MENCEQQENTQKLHSHLKIEQCILDWTVCLGEIREEIKIPGSKWEHNVTAFGILCSNEKKSERSQTANQWSMSKFK